MMGSTYNGDDFVTFELGLRSLARIAGAERAEVDGLLARLWDVSQMEALRARSSQQTSRVGVPHYFVGSGRGTGSASADRSDSRQGKESGASEAAKELSRIATEDGGGARPVAAPAQASGSSKGAGDQSHDEQLTRMMATLAEKFDGSALGERVNLLSGLEVKQSLPVIKDSDPDFKSWVADYETTLACYRSGRRGAVSAIDKLTLLRNCLPNGGVRAGLYMTMMRLARNAKRLPGDAEKVYEEVIDRLSSIIRETRMQRQHRVEQEFERLRQGALHFAAFRVEWEQKLLDMQEAGVVQTEDTLFRKLMHKLSQSLRTQVNSRVWQLDENGPARQPKTWQELVTCVEQLLDTLVDSRGGAEDTVNATLEGHEGGGAPCYHCQRRSHPSSLCPSRAAAVRNETAKCLADHAKSGASCSYCGAADHRARHHDLAAQDFAALSSGVAAGSGAPAVRREGGSGGQTKEEKAKRPCKFGPGCKDYAAGRCEYMHSEESKGRGKGLRTGDAPAPAAAQAPEPRGDDRICFRCRKRLGDHPDRRFCSKPGSAGEAQLATVNSSKVPPPPAPPTEPRPPRRDAESQQALQVDRVRKGQSDGVHRERLLLAPRLGDQVSGHGRASVHGVGG